jgi:hypothetical protein
VHVCFRNVKVRLKGSTVLQGGQKVVFRDVEERDR